MAQIIIKKEGQNIGLNLYVPPEESNYETYALLLAQVEQLKQKLMKELDKFQVIEFSGNKNDK